MARQKQPTHNGPDLFTERAREIERRIRRQRTLFIPRFLREAAGVWFGRPLKKVTNLNLPASQTSMSRLRVPFGM